MFHEIIDSIVILRSKGVFIQTKAFSYKGQVFAKKGNGFVKLVKFQRGTSCPTVSWESVQLPFEVSYDKLGVMLDTRSE